MGLSGVFLDHWLCTSDIATLRDPVKDDYQAPATSASTLLDDAGPHKLFTCASQEL